MAANLEVILRAKDYLNNTLREGSVNIDKMNTAARKLQVSFKSIFAATAGIAAVAGLRSMMSQSTELADKIDKLSRSTGLSTEEVQRWDYVLKMNGSTIENASRGIKEIGVQAYNAANGNKQAKDSFKALGVAITDASGALRPQQELFNDTLLALSEIKNSTERAALAQRLFGKSAMEILPIISDGADALKRQKKEAEDFGQILSAGSVKKLDELGDSFLRLGNAIKVGFSEGLALAAPFLSTVSDVATKSIRAMSWVKSKVFGNSGDDLASLSKMTDKNAANALAQSRIDDLQKRVNRAKEINDEFSRSNIAIFEKDIAKYNEFINSKKKLSEDEIELEQTQLETIAKAREVYRQAEIASIKDQTQKEIAQIKFKYQKIRDEIGTNKDALAFINRAESLELSGKSGSDGVTFGVGKSVRGSKAYERFSASNQYSAEVTGRGLLAFNPGEKSLDEKIQIDIEKNRQLLDAHNTLRQAEIDNIKGTSDREIAIHNERFRQLQIMYKDNSEALLIVKEAEAIEYERIEQQKAEIAKQNAMDSLGTLVYVMQYAAEKNREYAGIFKAVAYAEAIVKGAQSAVTAYAAGWEAGGPYAGAALSTIFAGISLAATGVQIAKISSTNFAQGGVVNGPKYPVDSVPAYLTGGEVVMNERQQANTLMAIANSGASGRSVVVHFHDHSGGIIESMRVKLRSGEGDLLIQDLRSRMKN